VNTRWQLVLSSVRGGYPLPSDCRDRWIDQGLAYLNALLACSTDADREAVALTMPAVETAVQVHRSADKLVRGGLEARLLTSQSLQDVSAACDLTLEAVEMYHMLFFDVRDKLQASCYIINHAMDGKYDNMTEKDVDVILKKAAFLRGPLFLDIVLRYYKTKLKVPRLLDGVTRDQLEKLHELLSTRMVIFTWVLPNEKIHRATLLHRLLKELKALIEHWPVAQTAAEAAAGMMAPMAVELGPQWTLWRQLVKAASTGRGLKADKGGFLVT